MASYDIIGGIVDPKALAELQNLEKIANNIAVKLRGVTLGSMSKEADAALVQRLNAETAKLVAQEQKLQNQIQKTNQARAEKIKLTTEEKVSQTALNNVEKLSAVLASQYTTALQKLDAQIKLNIIDAQKYVQAGDTQNPMYLQNIANTKKLSQEYDRLAKASGATMQKTSSMYGATFSLTQVMRELPNFAIDARIGFMALSNNLPMLAENFSRVKHEIDAITGKEKGFIGAFKEFGKSLLSLNTIMIVLSTVMILFGDKIIEAFKGKMTVAQKANEEFIKSLKEGNSEVGNAVKLHVEMQAILSSAEKGFISQTDAVEEYNKRFKDTNGEITTFGELQDKISKTTDDYVKAILMRAYANTYLEESLKNYSKAEALRRDKEVDFFDKAGYIFRNVFDNERKVYATRMGYEAAVLKEREDNAKKQDGLLKDNIKSYKSYYDEFAEFSKNMGLDFWGKTPSKATKKQIEAISKDVQIAVSELKPIDLTKLLFPTNTISQPNDLQFGDFITQSMNSQLNSLNEQYDAGIIGYKDYLNKRIALTNVAGEAGIEIQYNVNQKMADIDAEHYEEMLQYKAEIAQTTVDIIESIWIGFYERYIDKLEETAEKEKRIEDEKLRDLDDREKAGVITKQQAEEEKLRIEAYSMSVQDELDRQKDETERKQFLLEQAAAIARIWVDFATASGSLENLLAGGAFTPLYLGIALASTGLAAAQAIPYFAEGGIMEKSGLAVLGDGGKHEVAISPSGQYFISDNKPTMYNLEKGTEIKPDINRMDLASILALKQVMPEMKDNTELLSELRNVTNAVKSQRQGNFYGMPLIKQIENRNKYSSRSRSLMN